jgi:hypothetical protein
MPKKRFGAEQIVTLLRQIEVSMAQGKPTPVACRDAGISQQSYYRWRKEYGGLEIDQAKRMKDLERENVRLKRLVADPFGAGRGWPPRSWRRLLSQRRFFPAAELAAILRL